MLYWGWFIYFILGISVGSFLNVLIDRLAYGQSILGRSYCDKCKRKLSWQDLFPLFSFLFLQGKCRYCRKKISFYYPLVELITGIFFVFVSSLGLGLLKTFLLLGIVSLFIVIFFTDLKYMLIPDEIQVLLLIFSFFYRLECSSFCLFEFGKTLFASFFGGIIVSLPLVFLFFLTREKGIGFGDVKLGFNIGFLFGIKAGFFVLYISFLIGGAVSVLLLLLKRKRLKSKVPFGPFLVFSSLVFIFFPQDLYFLLKIFFIL